MKEYRIFVMKEYAVFAENEEQAIEFYYDDNSNWVDSQIDEIECLGEVD